MKISSFRKAILLVLLLKPISVWGQEVVDRKPEEIEVVVNSGESIRRVFPFENKIALITYVKGASKEENRNIIYLFDTDGELLLKVPINIGYACYQVELLNKTNQLIVVNNAVDGSNDVLTNYNIETKEINWEVECSGGAYGLTDDERILFTHAADDEENHSFDCVDMKDGKKLMSRLFGDQLIGATYIDNNTFVIAYQKKERIKNEIIINTYLVKYNISNGNIEIEKEFLHSNGEPAFIYPGFSGLGVFDNVGNQKVLLEYCYGNDTYLSMLNNDLDIVWIKKWDTTIKNRRKIKYGNRLYIVGKDNNKEDRYLDMQNGVFIKSDIEYTNDNNYVFSNEKKIFDLHVIDYNVLVDETKLKISWRKK